MWKQTTPLRAWKSRVEEQIGLMVEDLAVQQRDVARFAIQKYQGMKAIPSWECAIECEPEKIHAPPQSQ
jgi:hypothetical protein